MARDTATDTISNDLIQRYVSIISLLDGLGIVTDASGTPTGKAVYPNLGVPMPQEPFPSVYVYVGGIQSDWGLLHQGIRRDTYTVNLRLIGGMATPRTVVAQGTYEGDYPEVVSYKLLTGIINELTYRPFLNDPITNEAFRYLDPNSKASTLPIAGIRSFNYSEQGNFIGIEIPASVTLQIKINRIR